MNKARSCAIRRLAAICRPARQVGREGRYRRASLGGRTNGPKMTRSGQRAEEDVAQRAGFDDTSTTAAQLRSGVVLVHPSEDRRFYVAKVPDFGANWPKIQPVLVSTAVPHSGQVPDSLPVRL